ncbi:MAG TPA: hypothetical protein PKD85_00250, partial [Saprospiraceae bacterium]|nr:hypothetical protein [Saprospiraceae bacterium]
MIGIFLILIFFLIFYISRNREKFVSLPATLPSTITKTALYTIPLTNRPSHITLFGGGGGGAATNLATGNIYPGGGGGQGYAALGSIPINARYLNVVIGKGGTSDINGGTTIVQTLDENKNVIQTLFALGGYAGSQGYISTWDVPTPGDGGNGFCGGGGGGAGNFPVHQRTKQSTGGSGVLPQYNGADGSL